MLCAVQHIFLIAVNCIDCGTADRSYSCVCIECVTSDRSYSGRLY